MARAKAQHERTCPISGLPIPYKGRGRPPIYHPTMSKAVKRAWAQGRKVGPNEAGNFVVL